ncbi:hypothetical protein [Mangrovimonas xylaniphaga]|uniref:hypothetical protein n=1 Tax=Mangrovimonas xylaniphaga TaxID=1645915 RepID=UPI0006B48342|nr:hypothetical protein [Mangrovimonas xylaniphaga]
MTRCLLISLGLLFLVSCGSYPKRNGFQREALQPSIENLYFSNETKDYVYKANIEVYGKTFGGLFIVKKLGDNKHRVAFTTEMGNKLFDFSFENEEFSVNYILEELDRKMFINILRDDFWVLLKSPMEVEDVYGQNNFHIFETMLDRHSHFYFFENEQLKKVVRAKGGKGKVDFLFEDTEGPTARQIQIIHHNIKLKINLKSIK